MAYDEAYTHSYTEGTDVAMYVSPLVTQELPETFDRVHDVVGTSEIAGMLYAGGLVDRNRKVIMHMARVGTMMAIIADRAGCSEDDIAFAQQLGGTHDGWKPFIPETSDHGKWTEEARVRYRKQHTEGGGRWMRGIAWMLPTPLGRKNAAILAKGIEVHHTIPPEEYWKLSPRYARLWGVVHLLQGCDRLDALTSRPYVKDREGDLTLDKAVDTAMTDPSTYPLAPIVRIGGIQFDLKEGLKYIADDMQRIKVDSVA